MGNKNQYSTRLEFEHELINRRLTWLLTSQSILFAAYGLATRAAQPQQVFLEVTPVAGIAIAAMIFVGIMCGVFAKWHTWRDSKRKQFGVRTWITMLALVPDLMLPIVFACAWIWILRGAADVVLWLVLAIAVPSVLVTLLVLLVIGWVQDRKLGRAA